MSKHCRTCAMFSGLAFAAAVGDHPFPIKLCRYEPFGVSLRSSFRYPELLERTALSKQAVSLSRRTA